MFKKMIIMVFFLISASFMLGCAEEEKVEEPKDERCTWEAGRCLANQKGWYYHDRSDSCQYYEGDGCEAPPFDSKDKCQEVCLS